METPTTRCGAVALAGVPNAGKSTLLNALVGTRLAIVSEKPQSTREPVIAVVTEGDTQLIMVDPPGLFEPQYPLQESMRSQAVDALAKADAVLYLHPVTEGEPPPLQSLLPEDMVVTTPVLTVLTKADLSPTDRSTATLPDRLPVSALTGRGLAELRAWCRAHVPETPFRHPPDDISVQPVRFFVTEFVREAAFEILREELPYAIVAEVDEFREHSEPVYIRVMLYVERPSQKGMVIGSRGRTINALGTLARDRIETLLQQRVYLDLWVKVLPKWRQSPPMLHRLGFPLPTTRNA